MKDLNAELAPFIEQAFTEAYAYHGDLGLDQVDFFLHLYSLVNRRLGPDAPSADASGLICQLYLNDLYLALACARGNETAWGHFASRYGDHIRKVSARECFSREAANDLADSIPGHVFLPDATGRCRMASYEGISPLSAWLATIIRHLAFNERLLKANHWESLDWVIETSDESSIGRVEASVRHGRYRPLIDDSLRGAIDSLSERERAMLHLRYGRQLQVCEVARQLDVKPPAVSRQLDRTRNKLRSHFIAILAQRHRLGPAVIQDCLAHMLENPEHYALDFSGWPISKL